MSKIKILSLISIIFGLLFVLAGSPGYTQERLKPDGASRDGVEDKAEPLATAAPVETATAKAKTLPAGIPAEFPGLAEELHSFYYTKLDVRVFLKIISKTGKLNIVSTPNVKGNLTAALDKITINDALDIALITNGLAKEYQGNIISVMTEAEYIALYGEPYNKRRIVKTMQLKYFPGDKIAERLLGASKGLITAIKSNVGSFVVDPATKTIVMIETPEKIKEIEKLLAKIDVPVETQTFEIKNADLGKIEKIIDDEKTPIIGKYHLDYRMKQIMITDTSRNLFRLADIIRTLDDQSRQVLVEARMIQINLNDDFYMGIEWDKIFSSQSSWNGVDFIQTTPIIGKVIKTADKTGTSVIRKTGLEATIGKILPGNFYSTIQLLQEFGTTRIISSPRLYVTNGQSARFMVGSKEAYVTSTVTSTQASTTTSETVEFIDVGITLAVTPTINSDGFIKMSLDPEISQITDRIETAQGNFVPILQTTNVSTEVIVKDGVTIVLAGLIRDEDRKSSSGIPILSKIPILGALFRSTTDVKVKRETVIFVTPYLMTGEADTSIKIRQRDLMEKKPRSLKSIR